MQQEINTFYEIMCLFLSVNEKHHAEYGKYASITLIDDIFSNTRKLVDKNYRAKHYKLIMAIFKKYKSVLHIIFAWSFFVQNTREFDKLTFSSKLCFVITIAYDIQEILKQYRIDNSINKFLIDELIEVPANLIKFTRPKSQGLDIKKIIPELKGQELEAYKNYKNYSKVIKAS